MSISHETKNEWTVQHQREISYSILKNEKIFDPRNKTLLLRGNGKGSKRFVVVDDFIHKAHENEIKTYFSQNKVEAKIVPFEGGEKNKNYKGFTRLFKELDNFQVNRRSEPIIAIGGGVVTDIVGYIASSYRRGIPHIKVPTTLMGYVDASVGIKTGINFSKGKNRMGSFEAPKLVILDKTFLKTLPKRHIINGIGEILKLAVIKEIRLLELLETEGTNLINSSFQENGEEVLDLSISAMIEELEPNLFETELCRSVDFGHTFSLILEMDESNNLLHGEAVAIDVGFSTVLAHQRNLITTEEKDRVFSLMKKLELPYRHPSLKPDLLWKSVVERTYHRDGYQRIPLPASLGKCTFIDDLSKNELEQACMSIGEL